MKSLLKKVLPKRLKEKYWEYRNLQEYLRYKKTEGNTYNCFDKTQTIFIHIPKAGGISVIKSLYGEQAEGIGHRTYEHFIKVFGKKNFERYYKFTFVRNPFDRLLSAYSFLKKGGMNHLDEQFQNKILSNYDSFESFVMEGLNEENILKLGIWTHFYPQHKFLCDENDNIMVNYVGRFERFNDDYETIRKRVPGASELKHFNKTKDKKITSYRDAYTQEMKEKVERLYKKDLEIFGYDF